MVDFVKRPAWFQHLAAAYWETSLLVTLSEF